MKAARFLVAGVILGACLASPTMAVAGDCVQVECGLSDDGGNVGVTDPKPQKPERPESAPGIGVVVTRPSREQTRTPGCPGNDPNAANAYDVSCAYMVTFCQTTGGGPGPLTWIWSRPLERGAPTGRWVRVGYSCNEVPAAPDALRPRPVLTSALVRQAFRDVGFAKPTLHVQPEGNVTLLNLPTYFEVRWPTSGFEPDEVATVELLGRSVRIRPLEKSYTYRFGDGAAEGPTSDAGGPYPDGKVRHTYQHASKVSARVTATYGGEFSVDGGEWQEVGETVNIAGPPAGIEVRRAHARLEAG